MRIALAGLGITGKQVAEYILEQNDALLETVVVSSDSSKVGVDVGELLGRTPLGTTVIGSCSLAETLQQKRPQVLLDFSNPAFIHDYIELLAESGINLVIATTGHSLTDIDRIKYYTHKYHIGTVMAPNITFGVNVLMELCKYAARLMSGYDFEIIESHHRHKKDSPSGTAKRIAEKIVEGSNLHPNSDIAIHSIRAGGIVGDHKVVICGPYDQIELRHESFSRKAFAQGALWAAQFITKHRGFYFMEDVFAASLLGFQRKTCVNCGDPIEEQSDYAQSLASLSK